MIQPLAGSILQIQFILIQVQVRPLAAMNHHSHLRPDHWIDWSILQCFANMKNGNQAMA